MYPVAMGTASAAAHFSLAIAS